MPEKKEPGGLVEFARYLRRGNLQSVRYMERERHKFSSPEILQLFDTMIESQRLIVDFIETRYGRL